MPEYKAKDKERDKDRKYACNDGLLFKTGGASGSLSGDNVWTGDNDFTVVEDAANYPVPAGNFMPQVSAITATIDDTSTTPYPNNGFHRATGLWIDVNKSGSLLGNNSSSCVIHAGIVINVGNITGDNPAQPNRVFGTDFFYQSYVANPPPHLVYGFRSQVTSGVTGGVMHFSAGSDSNTAAFATKTVGFVAWDTNVGFNSKIGAAAGSYGIYCEGAAINRFNGNIGINLDAPTNARLTFPAGSTTVAPIRFTTGSLLSAAVAFTLECDATGVLSMTGSTAARSAIAQLGLANIFTVNQRINGTLGMNLAPASNARIAISAGTTALAPLLLTTTAAALLTTPVAGVIETDGVDLYWTGSSGGRRKITAV